MLLCNLSICFLSHTKWDDDILCNSFVCVGQRKATVSISFYPPLVSSVPCGVLFPFTSVLCSRNSTCDHSKLPVTNGTFLWITCCSADRMWYAQWLLTRTGGVVISCPRSVLSLCISPERPAKPDSSGSVAILQGNNCITARIKDMLSFRVEKNIFLEAKKHHVHRCGSLLKHFPCK